MRSSLQKYVIPQGMLVLWCYSGDTDCGREANYTSGILIYVPWIFYYFVLWQTNAQLFHKLSHFYMFRHYRVILRELVITTLPSYTNAAVGNTVYN